MKAYPSLAHEHFTLILDDQFSLVGKIRFIKNAFTEMPRGQISLSISQASLFKKLDGSKF